ncbi:MAG: class I SAM-dependent methyltransferase [Azospira sp.]|jgi:methylase of polypeptide subunit release factors|nr:class I SAM-dependent methyltransferase [Azospira sp.]
MTPTAPITALPPTLHWEEGGATQTARWRSEAGATPPKRVVVADDLTKADTAYQLACEGTALLWRGDFQNARQLLQAMGRRAEKRPRKTASITEAFHQHRMAQAQRARTLGLLLIPVDGDYAIPLRRAPDVTGALGEAWGAADGEPSVVSLRELQGLIGAHEWRKKGVPIPALGESIHPHYGVFSPVRGEYIDLVAEAPLPSALETASLAFDIGTGTGVLAAVLARRGVRRIVGTDRDPRALACARENIDRLGLGRQVKLVEADLFPEGRAPLIVCNPPWLPGKVAAPIEGAVYDPDSRMLKGFLAGLKDHLAPDGEGWLILSDFAEHLGLRQRGEVLRLIEAAGLKVVERHDTRPTHKKAADRSDPLYLARVAEKTSLWRLAAD